MAIDRRNGTEVAMETVKLAEEFMLSSGGLVVGIDLSGDPTVSKKLWGSLLFIIYIPRIKLRRLILNNGDEGCNEVCCCI